MAYDEELAARVRQSIGADSDVREKRMFGGLAFLVAGKMSVAVTGRSGLMVRVAPEETEAAALEPHAGPMEMRGRPIDGWVLVDTEGLTAALLEAWVERGVGYARSLATGS